MRNGTVGVVDSNSRRSSDGMKLVGLLEKSLVSHQDNGSQNTETDIPSRPPILPIPTRTLKYMNTGRQAMLCLGEHNKCRLKLVPLDARALANSKEVSSLKGSNVELEYDAATCGGGVSAIAYHKVTTLSHAWIITPWLHVLMVDCSISQIVNATFCRNKYLSNLLFVV